MRLENWSMSRMMDGCFFLNSDANNFKLYGEIYDDSKGRFKDGTHVSTSRLIKFDPVLMIATTQNSTYSLGEMSEVFTEWMIKNGCEVNDCILKENEEN